MEPSLLRQAPAHQPALETFLVEWKQHADAPEFAGPLLLETFLVEWKPIHLQAPRWRHSPLKPS